MEFSFAFLFGAILSSGGWDLGLLGETRLQQMNSRLPEKINGIARLQLVELVRQYLRNTDFASGHPIPGLQPAVGLLLESCEACAKPHRLAFRFPANLSVDRRSLPEYSV